MVLPLKFSAFSSRHYKEEIKRRIGHIDAKTFSYFMESETLIPFRGTALASAYAMFARDAGRVQDFTNFLLKEMNYKNNSFSDREFFEIFISFFRPTLHQYREIKIDNIYDFIPPPVSSRSHNYSYANYSQATRNVVKTTQSKPSRKKVLKFWHKRNFAALLFARVDRKDFLSLLIQYNRHQNVCLKISEKKWTDAVSDNIEKGSQLYALCEQYLAIDSGFTIGLSIAHVEEIYDLSHKENSQKVVVDHGSIQDYSQLDDIMAKLFEH